VINASGNVSDLRRSAASSVKRKAATKHTSESTSDALKGWQSIAQFLGQPVSVAQHWAKTGMPVSRQGRYATASPEELNKWLGRESGQPVHVATEDADLSAELKRGLSHLRNSKRGSRTPRK
jgi:hypothetical protein